MQPHLFARVDMTPSATAGTALPSTVPTDRKSETCSCRNKIGKRTELIQLSMVIWGSKASS
jgi:hypothetical protein